MILHLDLQVVMACFKFTLELVHLFPLHKIFNLRIAYLTFTKILYLLINFFLTVQLALSRQLQIFKLLTVVHSLINPLIYCEKLFVALHLFQTMIQLNIRTFNSKVKFLIQKLNLLIVLKLHIVDFKRLILES